MPRHTRSYIPWNIAGIVVAIIGFVIGALKGPMGGGGAHTAIGAALGVIGTLTALAAYALERRHRRATRSP
jgi:membrane-bound ClpP family serine protease